MEMGKLGTVTYNLVFRAGSPVLVKVTFKATESKEPITKDEIFALRENILLGTASNYQNKISKNTWWSRRSLNPILDWQGNWIRRGNRRKIQLLRLSPHFYPEAEGKMSKMSRFLV